jgi:DNA-binding transcriptional MocR family regulator
MPLAMEPDGVDIVALEAAVEREFRRRFPEKDSNIPEVKRFWAMFYTIPTFHNPSGVLTSPEKCRKIIQIARKFDLVRFAKKYLESENCRAYEFIFTSGI